MRKKFSALIFSSMILQQASAPTLGYELAQTSGVESSNLEQGYIDKNIELQEIHDLHIEFSPYDPLAISTSWLDPNTNTLIFSDSVNPISGSVSVAEQERIAQELINKNLRVDIEELGLTTDQAFKFLRELLDNDKRLFHVSENLSIQPTSEGMARVILAGYDRHLTDKRVLFN
ncbi:hypothetical protein AN643_00660 [Candidatus Epulonipiscioides saccharophilum]|nr:hypothetical protein AN643_00660 [Epulopiscium sp. SCG-B10WGA-EpuloB]